MESYFLGMKLRDPNILLSNVQFYRVSTKFSYNFNVNLWLILVHVIKNCIKYQILIGTISTFSVNFIQINKGWPQLQPKTWSEAILRIHTILDHFIIYSLQKGILEAAIDSLDIQLGTISPFNQYWISRQSITASKMQTFVHSENGLGSQFRLYLRPHLINLNEIFRKCGHDTN